ncbi:hypothetical protein CsSME_00002917 [Camellia sinensis var. sinensis]
MRRTNPVQKSLADSPVRRSLVVSSVTTVGAFQTTQLEYVNRDTCAVKGRTELSGARSSLRL